MLPRALPDGVQTTCIKNPRVQKTVEAKAPSQPCWVNPAPGGPRNLLGLYAEVGSP
jgi:hypothetical protein